MFWLLCPIFILLINVLSHYDLCLDTAACNLNITFYSLGILLCCCKVTPHPLFFFFRCFLGHSWITRGFENMFFWVCNVEELTSLGTQNHFSPPGETARVRDTWKSCGVRYWNLPIAKKMLPNPGACDELCPLCQEHWSPRPTPARHVIAQKNTQCQLFQNCCQNRKARGGGLSPPPLRLVGLFFYLFFSLQPDSLRFVPAGDTDLPC